LAARAGLTTEEVVELGIERKCRPSKEDQPVSMAARAAVRAFEQTDGVKPEDVDLVIFTGEEYKDYIAQTASIRLQEELGCGEGWAFDLVGQSVTFIQGLRVARDVMIGDDSVNTVLLAGGTRNVDLVDYANPHTRFLLASSASGGAVIIRRGLKKNLLLTTAFAVHPEMADEVYVPGGGTELPFSPENLNSTIMHFQVFNPEIIAGYFSARWAGALAETAQKALNGKRPDYLALRHLAPVHRRRVLEELGIEERQSASLAEWGHHGVNDVLISLDLGIKSGAVSDGSLVTLVSGGIGFSYAAAVIRWGSV
jgi:3-oxoacyl-[acyl-carrier-protein] synthase III